MILVVQSMHIFSSRITLDSSLTYTQREALLHHMPQFSHADGLKLSLWIDPTAHSPPWPACGHAESFMKSPTPTVPSSSLTTAAAPLTRQETIWQIYLSWIVHGTIPNHYPGTSSSTPVKGEEFRQWTPADEFDPLERVDKVFKLVDFGDEGDPVVVLERIRKGAKSTDGAKL